MAMTPGMELLVRVCEGSPGTALESTVRSLCAEVRRLDAALESAEAALRKERGVFKEAVVWWRSHRPLAFTEAEHLAQPTINSTSQPASTLMRAVAAALAAEQETP